VVACVSGLDGECGSYATGTATRWLAAIKEGAIEELSFGGGRRFAEDLVRAMHLTLMRT
jgi:hypothetical protein